MMHVNLLGGSTIRGSIINLLTTKPYNDQVLVIKDLIDPCYTDQWVVDNYYYTQINVYYYVEKIYLFHLLKVQYSSTDSPIIC